MNKTHVLAPSMALALGDDAEAVRIRYDRPFGYDTAILAVGDALNLHVTDASPDLLRRLAAAALELAAWREVQIAQARVAYLESGGLAVAS